MTADAPWDLLVIGGGTAGIVAAKTAAGFGARVLLAERDRTGGDCLWTGCVPSKALLAAGEAAARARTSARFGVHIGEVTVDFAQVMAHVRGAITTIAPVDSPEALEAAGVRVVTGDARFTSPSTASIDGSAVRFVQAVIATGAAPAVPPIPGLDHTGFLTSDTVWDLTKLPGRLVVLGGGTIGCELGQAFARLGSQVTVIESADRLIPHEDPAASELVRRSLETDGAQVLLGSAVSAVEPSEPGMHSPGTVQLANGNSFVFDQVLVAAGRRPRSCDLGLTAAGVEADDRGFVRVDKHLRTTNPRIWAAGDVTAHPQFTHTAGVNASLAASNAVLGLRRTVDTTTAPRVTFTHPEVAAAGIPTGPGQPAGLRVITWEHEHADRAVTDADMAGFTRLVVDSRSRILGATIVGPRAGESLAELALAIRHGMRARDLAGTTHAYPTYSDAGWNATIAEVKRSLAAPGTARATRTLARLRRAWLAAAR